MASAPSSLYRQARYRGTSRSWHAVRRLQAGAWLLAFALIGGGCSVSYQLDGLHANKDAGVPDQGDSPRAAEPKATAEMPAGTVTPLAAVYSQDGITCRDFLASYVKDGSESWLQGAACRAKHGKWEVRNLRPWNNT